MRRGQRGIPTMLAPAAALVLSLAVSWGGVAGAQQADPSTTTTPTAPSTTTPATTSPSTPTSTPSTTTPATTTTPASTTTTPATVDGTSTYDPSAGSGDPGVVQPSSDPVPGRYLVTLKTKDKRKVVPDVAAVTKRHGGKVTQVWGDALQGYAAEMTPEQAAAVAQDPTVERVEQDSYVHTQTTENLGYSDPIKTSGCTLTTDSAHPGFYAVTLPMQNGADSWGLDRIDQSAPLVYTPTSTNLPIGCTGGSWVTTPKQNSGGSYSYQADGTGVTAYVIDTGIYVTNTDFEGRATVGVDEVGDGQNGIDCAGHGTHVAGTIGGAKYGVAKKVHLVAVRVLDCSGNGSYANVINGINWVVNNAQRPAVANMSLGGPASPTLDSAVNTAVASGITFAVAAGNNSTATSVRNACNYSPSRAASAITVGATTFSQTDTTIASTPIVDDRASYSNGGSCVDIFGPGSKITSDWMGASNTATNTISGTSMATPHVVGVAALYLAANPCATPAQVTSALVDNSVGNAIKGYVASPLTNPSLTVYDTNSPAAPNKLLNMQFVGANSVDSGKPCPPVATASIVSGQPRLSWTIDTADGGTPDTFNVYRGTTPGGEDPTPIASPSAPATSYDDATATTGGTYYYKIGAENAIGESVSEEVAVTPPGAPGSVTASPGNGHVLVQWAAGSAGTAPVTGYTVQRSLTSGGASTPVGTVGAGTLQLDDPSATNGTQYFYTVTANSAWGDTTSAEASTTPTDWTGTYVPLTPARILDSRVNNGLNGVFTSDVPRTLQVTGRGGVPATGVSAVVMNVTVTDTAGAGHVTVYPADASLPNASNLNFTTGRTVPNLVTVGVSPSGQVKLVVHGGPADLIADVAGYYANGTYVALNGAAGSKFHANDPYRIVDTRPAPFHVGTNTTWGPNSKQDITLTGVPADATAVVLNVTVTGPTAASWATVYPSQTTLPDPASTLNFVAGQTVPNLAIVKIGANDKVSLYNLAGNVDVIVDVVGWYGGSTADAVFTPITPSRILDSRSGPQYTSAFASDNGREVLVTGMAMSGGGTIPAGAVASVMNVTVTDTVGPGHVIVWPADASEPVVSNLNFTTGLTVPNLVMVKLASGTGDVDMLVHGGPADLIADVVGYFTVP